MAVVILDRRLTALVDPDATADRIATGYTFTEGPVWNNAEQHLTFSDIPGNTIYRWTEKEGARQFRFPSGNANGATYDKDGALIHCEHANRRVSRTLSDGSTATIADKYEGKRLNSPNDVVGMRNGDLLFTDPPYGLRQPDGSFAPQDLPYCGVYRLASDGRLSLLVEDMERPNGLVVTGDQVRLYVADTQRHHIRGFKILSSGELTDLGIFAELTHAGTVGFPDGMKLDSVGNLYVAGNTDEGIWVFDPDGALLGMIRLPERPANLAWGGDGWNRLFVTAQTSVYRLEMRIAGQTVVGQ